MQKDIEYKSYHNIIYLIVFIILLIACNLMYGEHVGHDLFFHLTRLEALQEAINNNNIISYIDLHSINEYGYGIKFFYPDILLIPFSLLANYIGIQKSYFLLLNTLHIATFIISYYTTRKLKFDEFISFSFSILYTFSYYRLYDLYNRSALGESMALTFLPIIILGMYEIVNNDYKKWYILTIGFTLIVYSHLLSSIIACIFCIIYTGFNYKKLLLCKKRIIYIVVASIVTILLTFNYLAPLIEQFNSNEFYVQLKDQRAISFPVYEAEKIKYVIRGLFSGMTYVVPEIAGIGIIITFFNLLRISVFKNRTNTYLTNEADKYLIYGLISLFIVTPLYPWKIFPFSIINIVQFSWRFYSLATLLLSISGALYLSLSLNTNKRKLYIGTVILVALNIIQIYNCGTVFKLNFEQLEWNKIDKNKLVNYGIMGGEYLPQKVPNISFFKNRSNDSIRITYGENKIQNLNRENRILSFELTEKNETKLEVPLTYYKGYEAKLNAKKIDLEQSEYGLVEVKTNDNGLVEIFYEGTFIQKISPYISLISFIALILYIFRKSRKNSCI